MPKPQPAAMCSCHVVGTYLPDRMMSWMVASNGSVNGEGTIWATRCGCRREAASISCASLAFMACETQSPRCAFAHAYSSCRTAAARGSRCPAPSWAVSGGRTCSLPAQPCAPCVPRTARACQPPAPRRSGWRACRACRGLTTSAVTSAQTATQWVAEELNRCIPSAADEQPCQHHPTRMPKGPQCLSSLTMCR